MNLLLPCDREGVFSPRQLRPFIGRKQSVRCQLRGAAIILRHTVNEPGQQNVIIEPNYDTSLEIKLSN